MYAPLNKEKFENNVAKNETKKLQKEKNLETKTNQTNGSLSLALWPIVPETKENKDTFILSCTIFKSSCSQLSWKVVFPKI